MLSKRHQVQFIKLKVQKLLLPQTKTNINVSLSVRLSVYHSIHLSVVSFNRCHFWSFPLLFLSIRNRNTKLCQLGTMTNKYLMTETEINWTEPNRIVLNWEQNMTSTENGLNARSLPHTNIQQQILQMNENFQCIFPKPK